MNTQRNGPPYKLVSIKVRLTKKERNKIHMLAKLHADGNASQFIRDSIFNSPVRVSRMKKKSPPGKRK